MKNIAFHNLGCKVNSYELDVVQQKFIEKGYTVVSFDEKADIYVVNTCTVTNIADRKSRQMLHQAKARNKDALVVALGCYVQTGIDTVNLDESIDLAIGNNRKKDTVEIVEAYLAGRSLSEEELEAVIDINHTDEYEEMTLTHTGEHTRAYIKIQDGCNQFCTYCIIPFARGRVRSRKVEDIKNEIEQLVKNGYKEIVLTGIHISSYGVDFDNWEEIYGNHENVISKLNISDLKEKDTVKYGKGKSRLLELILMLHDMDGIERIRLGSLEPQIVTESFAKTLSELPKICPHFHLSLQSGCDETLKRMNRKYNTEEFMKGVEYLRQYFDKPAITTDVITGFPGETEEEFAKTKAFLEKVKFFEMHIFPYSIRKGTVAATMKNQVNGELKKSRSKKLLIMDEALSEEYRKQFLNIKEEVLFEEEKEIQNEIYILGHTKRYVKVAVKKNELSEELAENICGNIYEGELVSFLTPEILSMNI